MSKSVTIKRKRVPDDHSFTGLKKAGLQYLREISGKRWTDHNVHDPGITILDQLCYALTDLNYRSSFGVAELLAGEAGEIDFKNLALLPPRQAFSCRPTTITDYRKFLLSAVPEAANIWIEKKEEEYQCIRGLYSISVALEPKTVRDKGQIQREILGQFRAMRNLCEDIEGDVTFLESRECELHATIEIEGSRTPAAILADVYHVCDTQIFPYVEFRSYISELNTGASLCDIFDGPYTPDGNIPGDELQKTGENIHIADIVSEIKKIEGVKRIQHFCLTYINDDTDTPIKDSFPRKQNGKIHRLSVPSSDGDIRVEMRRGHRRVNVTCADMQAEYEKYLHRVNKKKGGADSRSDSDSWTGEAPRARDYNFRGQHSHDNRYCSIQNDFPVNYEIGPTVFPKDKRFEDLAYVKQLRAYLLFFDQIMANHGAHISHLKTVYSPKLDNETWYATRVLDDNDIPRVSHLYNKTDPRWLSDLQKKYDNYAEHKGRLLDYLLALYGESFTQHALAQFDYYLSPGEIPTAILKNKVNMLNDIGDLNGNRAAAAQYDCSGNNAMSGLERKARLLLGFDINPEDRSLTKAISEFATKSDDKGQDIEALLKQGLKNEGFHIPSDLSVLELLHKGVDISNYRLLKTSQNITPKQYKVKWIYGENKAPLTQYTSREHAKKRANDLRNMLIDINTSSEGMHVVEHVLLRPGGFVPGELEDFYNFRISIILSSWTARCCEPSFQELVKETVALICPSHIHAEIHFLDFPRMRQFESLLFRWRECSSGEKVNPRQLAKCAAQLREFLWLEELEGLLGTGHKRSSDMNKLEDMARKLRSYLWPSDIDDLLQRKREDYPGMDVSVENSDILRQIFWLEEPWPALQRYMKERHLDKTTLKIWTEKLQDFLRYIDFRDLLILWRKLYPDMEEFKKHAGKLRNILWLEDVRTEWRKFKILQALDPVELKNNYTTFMEFLWFEELLAEWRAHIASNSFDIDELEEIVLNLQDLLRGLNVTP